jgi:hypothetical protein
VKTSILFAFLLLFANHPLTAQQADPALQVIEGGKLIVDLIQALGSKSGTPKDPGCKNRHADLCVENKAASSLNVSLECRATGQKRDLVILPGGRECCLQLQVGVWTYDLRPTGAMASMRKGDIRIEDCQDLLMQIK